MTTKTNKNIMNNNITMVRNIVYKRINDMRKDIKDTIEVDSNLLNIVDINMKNAINKILHDYKLQNQQ